MNKNLTIVISTRDINNCVEIKKNIDKTIGIKEYFVKIYQNNGEFSLSTIYNKGLNESETDIVLFLHDDIEFLTKNWGKIILNHFNNSNYGILGIAGTTELRKNGVWWQNKINLAGNVYHINNNKKILSEYSNNFQNTIVETVLVDGLFISVDKKRLKTNFNSDFKGFHFYDVSFCVDNYLKECKIGVVSNISVIHKSVGNIDDNFLYEKSHFLYKYDNNLPIRSNITLDYIDKPINIKNKPKCSVIIPHIGNTDKINELFTSIFKYNTDNIEFFIADTGSDKQNLSNLYFLKEKYKNINIIEYNYYNFSKINNDVVKNHIKMDTEVLLFLNNDIKLVNDAINILLQNYIQNKQTTGTIGCRLHFEDNSVQHGGIITIKNHENYIFTHRNYKSSYQYYNNIVKSVIGNTAAMLLTPYNLFIKIGGFNENYVECYEDVEYNLQCIIQGKTNIFCGNAVAYHYESLTRGNNQEKKYREQIDYNRVNSFFKNNIKYFTKYVI